MKREKPEAYICLVGYLSRRGMPGEALKFAEKLFLLAYEYSSYEER